MSALLKIVDEHFGPGGTERRSAVQLRLVSQRTTARDVIRQRVEAEVEALALRSRAHERTRSFLIDVEATSPEGLLNLPLVRRPPAPDRAEKETARAFAAFAKQQFIMLFDDRQVENLDDEITVGPASQVVFLYLTPLKGG